MSLIAVVHLAHEKLALSPTASQLPSLDIQVVTNSMTDPETELFFFEVRSETGDFAEFEAAIEDDETVADPLVVAESETTRMYRLKHLSETEFLSPTISELGGLVLDAKTDETGWRLRLQLPDREALATLWEHCRDEGIAFELIRIFENDETASTTPNVSPEQRTALLEAYRNGYFQEPREATQADLAEALDICSTAVGGRLRRGTRGLIEDVLLDSE